MSSSEPPSRVPPRGQSHESKAARDELSSKGKVEKVREVDADEARKQKFRSFYEDEVTGKEDAENENKPSPFDLASGKKTKGAMGPILGSSSDSGLEDVEDAIIPSPSYAPPPDVTSSVEVNEDDDVGTRALPRSDDFWHDVDFPPDQPVPAREFRETTPKKEVDGKGVKKKGEKKGEEKGEGFAAGPMKGEKKGEASPFGVPGKPEKKEAKREREEEKKWGVVKGAHAEKKEKEPSPFEVASKMKREESERVKGEKKGVEKKEKSERMREGVAMPMQRGEKEGESRGRGHEQKSTEITRTTLPPMPSYVEPLAAKAMTQAAPYIQTATAALFYQMVGSMYVMAGPQGVNRTEVVLNNSAFANSKFFGATIKIEKYATAPDSFNITLSGSDQAVVSFKENIPNLMAAFQNGNFTFRVNRLDVEYRVERPVFRRKDGEERGESGGGDLGERRK